MTFYYCKLSGKTCLFPIFWKRQLTLEFSGKAINCNWYYSGKRSTFTKFFSKRVDNYRLLPEKGRLFRIFRKRKFRNFQENSLNVIQTSLQHTQLTVRKLLGMTVDYHISFRQNWFILIFRNCSETQLTFGKVLGKTVDYRKRSRKTRVIPIFRKRSENTSCLWYFLATKLYQSNFKFHFSNKIDLS